MLSKLLAGLMVFIMVSMIFAGLGNPVEAQENTTWTYMVYMSGDSSLSANVPDDIQEMQAVGSGDGLNIIVLADTSGVDDSRLMRIIPGGQEDIPLTDIDQGWGNELEMGQASTLSEFVIWAAENYPADRYVLDLWGHGMGWAGVCPDKGNYLECQELRTALMAVCDAGINIDIISMDACQMGMTEIAYELRDMAGYAVLSEKDVPLDGWPYDRLLGIIRNDMNLTAEEFGIRMVNTYMDWGIVHSRYSLTLSLIDLSRIERVASSLDSLASEAVNMTGYFNPQFIRARTLTEEYDGNAEYDMRHLLSNMVAQTRCMGLDILAGNVSDAMSGAVVHERHWTNIQDESAEHAFGLSIWFPAYSPSLDYLKCDFARDTGWDEFLTAMAPFFQNPGRQEMAYNVQATGLDSDGNGLKDSIQVSYDASSTGLAIIDIRGPDGLVKNHSVLDTSVSGTSTFDLESFGAYSAAVYLWDDNGKLVNYSHFQDGLTKEGVSIISGRVTSDIGRELQWTEVSLVNSQGSTITSTNTDRTGHYSLQVIVPTDTNGSNLVVVCGLGSSQQNHTIQELADLNTVDFRLDTTNALLGPMIFITTIFIILGIAFLAAGELVSRRKVSNSGMFHHEENQYQDYVEFSGPAIPQENQEIPTPAPGENQDTGQHEEKE